MIYSETLPSERRDRYKGPHRPKSTTDIVALSHLRWDFVYQRPQHLMSRFAVNQRVFYVEEPVWDGVMPTLTVNTVTENLRVVKPVLPPNLSPEAAVKAQRALLDNLLEEYNVHDYAL